METYLRGGDWIDDYYGEYQEKKNGKDSRSCWGCEMRIEDDIKLDYSDVLICPKRSTLTSRYDVDMNREFTFVHSKKKGQVFPLGSGKHGYRRYTRYA